MKIKTIERHILEEQTKHHPKAQGELTKLLYDIALSGKIIASKTTKAGLTDILGRAGATNVQGEEVTRLDRFADKTIFRINDHTGRVGVMASEEHKNILPIPDKFEAGKYVLIFDPLDGSSNTDYNVSVGTIFAIFRRKTVEGKGTEKDCLQKGKDLVAAGYIIYGSSTMFVYTTGNGVHGFTLDPAIGEFILSHPNMKIPQEPKYYSVNYGNQPYWDKKVDDYIRYLQNQKLSLRYIGSLIADFHRNLLVGGAFCYPADKKEADKPQGKLRLLYEASPLAFVAEQAGGYASDGRQNILDVEPTELHQRVPFFVGSKSLIKKVEEYFKKETVSNI